MQYRIELHPAHGNPVMRRLDLFILKGDFHDGEIKNCSLEIPNVEDLDVIVDRISFGFSQLKFKEESHAKEY